MGAPSADRQLVRRTETWLVAHGLPYFVDRYRATVTGRLSRGRLVLVGVSALLIGVVVALIVGSWSGSVSLALSVGLSAAGAMLLLYGLGSLEAHLIARWALGRAMGSLWLLVPLLTRALPMLLLFITFLFINTEVWQVASALHGGVLWGTVMFFAAAAVGFLVARLARELDEFDDQVTLDDVVAGTRGTPLEQAATEIAAEDVDLPADAQVTGLQMVNLVLVLVIAQAVQVLLLAVAVFGFFVVFGMVAIDASVIESWLGHPPTHPFGADVLSWELIKVAVFLASFSGLYFTVTAITDEQYRKEFLSTLMDDLERSVAARVVYRRLRAAADAPGASGAPDPAAG